jgi:asparagine N-glycosylation enzyme membrane subunit Stt3
MELIQSINPFRPMPLKLEYQGLLISALCFILFPYLIRLVDSSAAAIDPGAWSAIILSISAVLVFQAITWWVIRAIWPAFSMYSREHFERNFKSLGAAHKVIIYLGFYLALLYAFVGVLGTLV